MLGAGEYLIGAAELAAIALAAAAGAARARSRLLSGWSGPPARLADLVLALAGVLWIAELLGSFGAFRELPMVLAVVAIGILVRLLVPPGPPAPRRSVGAAPASTSGRALPPAPPAGALASGVALLTAGPVIAHWSI